MNTVLKARENMCLRIMERLRETQITCKRDEEEVISILEEEIPFNYAEAEASMDDFKDFLQATIVPRKPSLPDQLREALHLPKDFSLTGTLEVAIVRIQKEEGCKSNEGTADQNAGPCLPPSPPTNSLPE